MAAPQIVKGLPISGPPIEVLTGLGLSAQEIAEATGTSAAAVGVTKHRARARKPATTNSEVTVQ